MTILATVFLTICFTVKSAHSGDIYGTAYASLPEECYSSLYSDADIERFVYANYSPTVRPVANARQPIHVSFGIIFERIVDLFERERMILIDAYLIVEWKNELIAWRDVPPINCSTKLIAPSNKIWVPDISVANAPEDKYSLLLIRGHKVEVTSDGVCDFYPSGIFNVTCSMNLRYFPFDEQVCTLHFAGWSYSSDLQELRASDSPIDFDNFTQHEQWDLYYQEAVNVQKFNPTDGKTYDEVQIILYLKRKPAYYLINMFIPPVIIAIVEAAIFGLPITHEIKCHISFTALLAFGFFQTIMIKDIPRDSGESLPLLSLYLDLIMVYIGMVLIGEGGVFVILERASRGQMPKPPQSIMKVVIIAAPLMGVNRKNVEEENQALNKQKKKKAVGLSGISLEFVHKFYSNLAEEMVQKQTGRQQKMTNDQDPGDGEETATTNGKKLLDPNWLLIASVVERIIFIVYIAALILTPIIIYVILPHTSNNV